MNDRARSLDAKRPGIERDGAARPPASAAPPRRCGGDAVVMRRRCGGDAVAMRWRCGGDAAVMGGDAVVMRWQCGGDAAATRRRARSGGGDERMDVGEAGRAAPSKRTGKQ
ncbi:hypothetical protein F4W02_27810 [Burkholderia pseudomallei]|nr:hypothetical protein [Burkholderia pseudomallei]